MQIFETIKQRTGIMVVGQTMGGKSVILKKILPNVFETYHQILWQDEQDRRAKEEEAARQSRTQSRLSTPKSRLRSKFTLKGLGSPEPEEPAKRDSILS